MRGRRKVLKKERIHADTLFFFFFLKSGFDKKRVQNASGMQTLTLRGLSNPRSVALWLKGNTKSGFDKMTGLTSRPVHENK